MIRPPHLPRSSEAPKTATLRGSKMPPMESRGGGLVGMTSPSLEDGFALLEHGTDAFFRVLGGVDHMIPALRQQQGAIRAVAVLGPHGLLDRPDRQGSAAGELVRDPRNVLLECLVGKDAGHEPPVVGLLRRDIVAEECHVEGPVPAEIMYEPCIAEEI